MIYTIFINLTCTGLDGRASFVTIRATNAAGLDDTSTVVLSIIRSASSLYCSKIRFMLFVFFKTPKPTRSDVISMITRHGRIRVMTVSRNAFSTLSRFSKSALSILISTSDIDFFIIQLSIHIFDVSTKRISIHIVIHMLYTTTMVGCLVFYSFPITSTWVASKFVVNTYNACKVGFRWSREQLKYAIVACDACNNVVSL